MSQHWWVGLALCACLVFTAAHRSAPPPHPSKCFREYALLAVRNLCEGNPANQASISALQPQGSTPGMDQALAEMGLEGHVNSEGNFTIGPRPA